MDFGQLVFFLSKLSCTDCGRNLTPVKLHVVAYITRRVQAKTKPRSRDNRKIKPTVYGEVLTSDEVVERLEQEEREKAEKAAEKEREKAEKAAQKAEKAAEKAKKAAERAAKKADKEAGKAAGRKQKKRTVRAPKRIQVDESESEVDNEEIGMLPEMKVPLFYNSL